MAASNIDSVAVEDGLPRNPIIVVGGGLSGLSAAHQAIINGANVILLDKQNFIGGNSTKATSGINGSYTRAQQRLKIKDSVEQFKADTLKSAKKLANEALIDALVNNSADAVEWLIQVFGLDLSLVSRLGGHSQPRTHRGHDKKFPGMAITYALMEKYDELVEKNPNRFKLLKKSKVVDLIKENDSVIGVIYQKDHKTLFKAYGPVIMSTGGYAADFTSKDSLIGKYRPDLLNLPSTNANHATGDGQKLIISKVNGQGVHMDKIQVHPTGLIPFKQKILKKTDKFIFLGAEALRGEGGIMLNSKGERFCDELGTRDYVSGKMVETIKQNNNNSKIFLILNKKASDVLDFHTRHYTQRGLMKQLKANELLKEIGCSEESLQKQFDEYNDSAEGKRKDTFGKKFFPACPFYLKDPKTGKEEEFYVSYITRVVHFTMGGVKINEKTQVINTSNKVIRGLYASGELAGGVHGENRLGGSSLLGCVVFGRIAADAATNYLLSTLSNLDYNRSAATERLNQISLHLDPSNPGRVIVDWNDQSAKNSSASTTTKPQASSKPSKASTTNNNNKTSSKNSSKSTKNNSSSKKNSEFKIPSKEFTAAEVAKHNKPNDCWVIVKNIVLNCTNFLPNHPGGEQSIINVAGTDATEVFEMLHEDKVIPKYAKDCVIGVLKGKKPTLNI
ncbi:hypothetical protein PACTADRAFT_1579 [Pachysolen tannophilus NRRL Y-2460]|uniref:Cytochrome b5 heme-binding domain-containing protein n=1 Tax=Pachysolen tannophilus NRRL Y-2460 TaxID=669874 RepID=A0A1E4TZ28_PACTA|nr:hypothetical protein PACTADRAFT_1579 [Pachysolen tannophilus NRRL Y-2460]